MKRYGSAYEIVGYDHKDGEELLDEAQLMEKMAGCRQVVQGQAFVSQYLPAIQLSCRDVDLSYHMSKVMAEQIVAWYGLNKKIQTIALRFGPIDKVFLGTSVSMDNATQAIKCVLDYSGSLWYEAFSIVDDLPHIDISKAKRVLGYRPEKPTYTKKQMHSSLKEKTV